MKPAFVFAGTGRVYRAVSVSPAPEALQAVVPDGGVKTARDRVLHSSRAVDARPGSTCCWVSRRRRDGIRPCPLPSCRPVTSQLQRP